MFGRFLKLLLRKKTPVRFGDLERTDPVSRLFASERGTPIDRYYIEEFLSVNADLIQGRVLEVGSDEYCRRFGRPGAIQCDVLHVEQDDSRVTLVGDLTKHETLPRGVYDCFICTQTLNFIYDLEKAVVGAHRLLRPGGTMLATVAGISQISRYDMDLWGDYWRFTTASTQKLFSSVFGDEIEVNSFGNVLAACAFLQGCSVEDLPDSSLLDSKDPDYQMLITVVARRGSE